MFSLLIYLLRKNLKCFVFDTDGWFGNINISLMNAVSSGKFISLYFILKYFSDPIQHFAYDNKCTLI